MTHKSPTQAEISSSSQLSHWWLFYVLGVVLIGALISLSFVAAAFAVVLIGTAAAVWHIVKLERTARQLAAQCQAQRDELAACESTAAALAQTSTRHERIVSSLFEGIVLQDEVGNIVDFNPSAPTILGLTADQLLGRSSIDPRWRAVHPDLSAFPGESHPAMRALQTGQDIRNVVMGVHQPDGSLRWININARPLFADDPAKPSGVVCAFIDITDQVNGQVAIAQMHNRLTLAIKAGHIGIWDWDITANRITWDDDMYRLYGISMTDFGGAYDAWQQGLHPDDRAASDEAIQLALRGEKTFDTYFRVVWPDGSVHHIHGLGIVERNAAGEPIRMIGTNRDVTEQFAYEASLRAAKEEAERASRTKSEFLANMSHEIRTPMNGILGMLTLLEHTPLDDRQLDFTKKAQSATVALLGIINDILDFSKVEAGKLTIEPHDFRLSDLASELSSVLASNVGDKEIELVFDIATDIPDRLHGDSLRLRQVLTNLATNAIKFTAQGDVSLQIRGAAIQADQISLECAVTDTGIGIPADKLDYIFQGFSQAEASTTRKFGGTGLGLAICKRLVALMGGELTVSSELGVGSCFRFAIPLAVVSDEQSDAAPQTAAESPLQVLIVEDNALQRALLKHMIDAMGWHSHTVDSGEAALAHLADPRHPPYQTILVDWQMPGLDGWETAIRIKHTERDAPTPVVVMITAHSQALLEQKPQAERDALLDGYLTKPPTRSMLHDVILEALAHRGHREKRTRVINNQQALSGLRLLVVEDNLLNQQVALGLLRRCGATVELAGGGIEGVALALAATPPFDAILMDMQMPDIDGLEATRRIRGVDAMRTVPIIAMTANAMPADRQACLDAGMVDHISKPIELDVLVATLLHHTQPQAATAAQTATPIPDARGTQPVFDAAPPMQRLGGDPVFFATVLETFLSDAPPLFVQMQSCVATAKLDDARRVAHTIKGMAATIGATALADLATSAETSLKQALHDSSNRHAASKAVSVLADALPATLTALREWLAKS